MTNIPALERHLFLSDFQIPDHDERSIEAVMQFIPDFKSDVVHLVGDILNLTKVSKYDQDVYYRVSFMDEIEEGRKIISRLVKTIRKASPHARINYYSGNHEERLLKYLSSHAPQLADLYDDDGLILSLPRLLELKKHDIKWVPYFKEYIERGNVLIEHGDIARSKSGFTGHGMLDRRGMSGFSGHTHRLAIVTRTQSGIPKFWVETGNLCKLKFASPYVKSPDWHQGFAIGMYDPKQRVMHPSIVPIIDHRFVWEGRIYEA